MARPRRSDSANDTLTPQPAKKRIRRGPEQLIADLEAKIQQLKVRAQAKSLKTSPAAKSAIVAIRTLDKGMKVAEEEADRDLQFAYVDARKPLAAYLEAKGLSLPKPRSPRGRRPAALQSA